MRNYASLRKQNKRSLSTSMVLALCVVLTTVMLFSRLASFVTPDTTRYIPLTTTRGGTYITVTRQDAPRAVTPIRPTMLATSARLAADWFRTYDDNTVWSGETDIEIFRVSYENEAGEITVHSTGGDKLLAPGTENTYSFALENTSRENLEFGMTMEAFFSDGTHVIPVEVKVWDHEGTYFAGSETEYVDVLQLNQVSDSGSLPPGYVMPYTLQWQWPFEVDDEYDTMLGNLAVEEDISLTIVIRTTASYTPTADDGEPAPDTGDASGLVLYSVLFLISLGMLLLLLLPRPRQEEDHA